MAKPKINSKKKENEALNRRLMRYVSLVQSVYDSYAKEAAKIVSDTEYSGERPFSISDYPETREKFGDLQNTFVNDMHAVVYAGTSNEWKESNIVQDLMAKKVLRSYGATINGEKQKVYFQTNSDALKAFQKRTENGFNLSTAIWTQSADLKREIEFCISSAIEKGTSAITLSKRLSRYLSDFDTMKKDYKEKYGKSADCNNCEYRSIRLARSEINKAYRRAEQTRWEQMDFIIGYEIKTTKSSKHKDDICDKLAGKYPLDFKWDGWHPNCMCYRVPVFKTEDEYWDNEKVSKYVNGDINEIYQQEITDVPENFKNWIIQNKSVIADGIKSGKMPEFISTNIGYVSLDRKKFVMNEGNSVFLRTVGGFHLYDSYGHDFVQSYNTTAMRGFDLCRFDPVIESYCDDMKIRLINKSVTILKNGNVKLKYNGVTEAGDEFNLERAFRQKDDERSVYHSLFEVPEELQGQGLSKKIFRELFTEYERMGIDSVTVAANIDVGGYCWAKYGFKCEKIEMLTSVFAEEKQMEELKRIFEKYGDNDLVPMNVVARLPYGKDILRSSYWHGVINLSDKTQMKYLHEYIGL